MSDSSPEEPKREPADTDLEEIRRGLRERSRAVEINQGALFRHASALPPTPRAGVLIAGWGPVVLFPFVPVLYFFEWKLALLALFLGVFWVGMGRRYAQMAIRRQCIRDTAFLKHALSVGLVRRV